MTSIQSTDTDIRIVAINEFYHEEANERKYFWWSIDGRSTVEQNSPYNECYNCDGQTQCMGDQNQTCMVDGHNDSS